MGALLGPNLRQGELEFVAIDDPGGEREEWKAAEAAAQQLERRLGITHLKLPRIQDNEGGTSFDDDSDEPDWWNR